MALNPSQIQAVESWLKANPHMAKCTQCGSPGPFNVSCVIPLSAEPALAAVPVVCRACGLIRLFSAATINIAT